MEERDEYVNHDLRKNQQALRDHWLWAMKKKDESESFFLNLCILSNEWKYKFLLGRTSLVGERVNFTSDVESEVIVMTIYPGLDVQGTQLALRYKSTGIGLGAIHTR